VDLLAVVGGTATHALTFGAGEEGGGGLTINLFWILVASLNFLLFLAILYFAAFKGIGRTLDERRARIEAGLRDADAARVAREQATQERQAVLTDIGAA